MIDEAAHRIYLGRVKSIGARKAITQVQESLKQAKESKLIQDLEQQERFLVICFFGTFSEDNQIRLQQLREYLANNQ